MAEPSSFDPERIVRTLTAHGVACVIVGGIGAQLHGAARPTMDFDLVADFGRQNLRRLAAAMRELGARTRTEGYVDEATLEASKALVHEDFFERMEITTWDTDAGALDVLRNIPAADGARQTYQDLAERSTNTQYGTVVVKVASLDDIVASKQWANRPKDTAALPELRSLQDRGDDRPGPAAGGVPSDSRKPTPGRGGPGSRTLANGLDRPNAGPARGPDRGVER
jgi:hypothetical protein